MSREGRTITVDMDARCIHCGKGDATPSGRCMGCIAKLIQRYGLDRARWPRDGKIR